MNDAFIFRLKAVHIHHFARQQIRIARLLDLYLAQHLAHNHFDMLIVDLYALQTVYRLHLTRQIVLYALDALDLQNIVRVYRALR